MIFIIVNADGELLKEAGLSANIGGNLYNFVFDICSNSWTTKNNDLRTNKLIANIIEISGNVTASWFNGNLSGTNATFNKLNMLGNIVLDNNYILDISAIKFSDGAFFNNNIFNANISSINSNITSVWGNIITMNNE